jgi:glycosyltransferase involved in cell wall biosynthesis
MMLTLAGGFVAQGLRVDLVLAKAEGPYLAQVPVAIRIVDLRARRTAFSLLALIRYLRRERPVVLLSALNHANIIAICAKWLAGTFSRSVVSVRNTLSSKADHADNIATRVMPRLARVFFPWSDAIIAVSQGVADDLCTTTGLSRDRIQVIYNPVVTPAMLAQARQPVPHSWCAAGQPPLVLSVGRLHPQKDFLTLLRAFALVRQRRLARLIILGEGEERSRLEALARSLGLQGDIAMPGFVDNPYAYMSRASVFVLSSAWEGLPGVLIEALALGTPVVATNCASGPCEILEGGKHGTLVPVGNVEAMAKAIEAALERPNKRQMLGSSTTGYTLETVVPQYLQVMGVRAAGTAGSAGSADPEVNL